MPLDGALAEPIAATADAPDFQFGVAPPLNTRQYSAHAWVQRVSPTAEFDSVPVMWIRSIRKRPRSIVLMLVGVFTLVLGVARQQIEGVGLGAGILLVMGGFHLILVAIHVERERTDSAE